MYIQRENGDIVGAFPLLQSGIAEEQIANNDAELITFLNRKIESPLETLDDIISQGQSAMEEAPLPEDLQKKILDLQVFIENYYKRGAIDLIVSSINEFTIPPERNDVTSGQRQQVDELKGKMLEVFSAT